jgi:hypothetical protein
MYVCLCMCKTQYWYKEFQFRVPPRALSENLRSLGPRRSLADQPVDRVIVAGNSGRDRAVLLSHACAALPPHRLPPSHHLTIPSGLPACSVGAGHPGTVPAYRACWKRACCRGHGRRAKLVDDQFVPIERLPHRSELADHCPRLYTCPWVIYS